MNLQNFTNNFQLFQTGKRAILAIDSALKIFFNKEKAPLKN